MKEPEFFYDLPEVPSLPDELGSDATALTHGDACAWDGDSWFNVGGQYLSEPGALAAAYQRDVAKRVQAERREVLDATWAAWHRPLRYFGSALQARDAYLSHGRHVCQSTKWRELTNQEVDGLVALAQAHYDEQTAEARDAA